MSETLIDENNNDEIEFAEMERDYEMSKSFNQGELLEKIEDAKLPDKWGERIVNNILWG